MNPYLILILFFICNGIITLWALGVENKNKSIKTNFELIFATIICFLMGSILLINSVVPEDEEEEEE